RGRFVELDRSAQVDVVTGAELVTGPKDIGGQVGQQVERPRRSAGVRRADLWVSIGTGQPEGQLEAERTETDGYKVPVGRFVEGVDADVFDRTGSGRGKDVDG